MATKTSETTFEPKGPSNEGQGVSLKHVDEFIRTTGPRQVGPSSSAKFPLELTAEPFPLGTEVVAFSIGLFLEDPTAKESRVYVRYYTRGKGVRRMRNERVGTIPNLVVNPKHWHEGNLSRKAPESQRERINAVRIRIDAFQADLQKNPRYVTAAVVRGYLWPASTDGWTKLFKAAAAHPKPKTAERYHYSLLSFLRFRKDQQPTPELFLQWAHSLSKKYEPASVNSYVGAVRSCFEAIGVTVTRKGLRIKEPKTKGGIALSPVELAAIYALPL